MEEDLDKVTASLYTVRKRSVEIPLDYLLSGMVFLSGKEKRMNMCLLEKGQPGRSLGLDK